MNSILTLTGRTGGSLDTYSAAGVEKAAGWIPILLRGLNLVQIME